MPHRLKRLSLERSRPPLPLRRKEAVHQTAPTAPTLKLNAEGEIQHLTSPARQLLEYHPDQEIETYFFAHVHGKNLYQVMRDVADMVCRGKARASWLVRLRTGQGRWRWYRATAVNRLDASDASIRIALHDLYDWQVGER